MMRDDEEEKISGGTTFLGGAGRRGVVFARRNSLSLFGDSLTKSNGRASFFI